MWICIYSGSLCWEKALISRWPRMKQYYSIQKLEDLLLNCANQRKIMHHEWLLLLTSCLVRQMCEAALFPGENWKPLLSIVFFCSFIPIAPKKNTYTTRQLNMNPPKEWCFWISASRIKQVEASVQMPWHLKRIWTSVWDPGSRLCSWMSQEVSKWLVSGL